MTVIWTSSTAVDCYYAVAAAAAVLVGILILQVALPDVAVRNLVFVLPARFAAAAPHSSIEVICIFRC